MRYIIINGGLTNKGLRAMVYIAVTRLSEIFPGKKIVLLTSAYSEYRDRRHVYRFEVLPWITAMKYACMGRSWRRIMDALNHVRRSYEPQELDRVQEILQNTDLAVDVSGFALSSQWPFMTSLKYLLHIAVMKKYGIKTYLLTQSFGPFDYGFPARHILLPLLRELLPYSARIYAREEDGLRALHGFTNQNLAPAPDLVLAGRRIDAGMIYRESPVPLHDKVQIQKPAVGIVPNLRVFERADRTKLLEIYRRIVGYLLAEAGSNVYVFWHSGVDRRICELLRHLN